MPRTTISTKIVREISIGTATKEEILRAMEADCAERTAWRERAEPIVDVTLHGWQEPAPGPMGQSRVRVAGHYVALGTLPLHDLTSEARVDVIRVGRMPGQDFQVADSCVSREHGLALLVGGRMMFCDYGTFIRTPEDAALERDDGGLAFRPLGRHGSMNGTYVDGKLKLQDRLIDWEQDRFLGFGRPQNGSHGFKLTYRRRPEAKLLH